MTDFAAPDCPLGERLCEQREVGAGSGMGDCWRGRAGSTCAHSRRVRVKTGVVGSGSRGLELPADWVSLSSGDAFVTRRVKAVGVYWNAWPPRGRNRPHRRRLGLFAPTAAITQARTDAEGTAERRARARVVSARARARPRMPTGRSSRPRFLSGWISRPSTPVRSLVRMCEVLAACSERPVPLPGG